MTPAPITIRIRWAILEGPSIDSLLEALKDDSTVEFTLIPAEVESPWRKLKLRAKVRQIGNLNSSDHHLVRIWRVKVEFISNRWFRVTNTSPVEIDYYTSGYGDRLGARGGFVRDATPDEERFWIAQEDGSIVRGLHSGQSKIIGNVNDLPRMKTD